MKQLVRGAVAAAVMVGSLALAGPADAASVSGGFTCYNGISTAMYSPYGYDYHEVNGRYYFWGSPSSYWTQVNWAEWRGYWYLESNTGFNYRVWCR